MPVIFHNPIESIAFNAENDCLGLAYLSTEPIGNPNVGNYYVVDEKGVFVMFDQVIEANPQDWLFYDKTGWKIIKKSEASVIAENTVKWIKEGDVLKVVVYQDGQWNETGYERPL